jgi:hypothetical protein
MTYNFGFQKNIHVIGKLILYVFDDIQWGTKDKESFHCDGSAMLHNFTSDQANSSVQLPKNCQ